MDPEVGDRDPQLDEEAIAEFVSEQAKEYDTYGKRENLPQYRALN